MCGITGFVTRSACPEGDSIVNRMTEIIRHRGPDQAGTFVRPPVFFGHRRLSIIDLSSAGRQPMANEDGSIWIVYNGEIFNHVALRADLERQGHRYHSRSDTETVLHAYEQYGEACVDQFRGMFAFAIWDEARQRLFAARDRVGIKPFYYYADDSLFAFASEIKALLQHPVISARLNESALAEYLAFGYVSDERTMFDGIRKLMPGHTLLVDASNGHLQTAAHRYWNIPRSSYGAGASERDLIAECRQRLEETVRMRMLSDVPVGVLLSGGLDSSAVAALASRMAGKPIHTFAIGYHEAPESELAAAARAAAFIGSDHHECVVTMDDFFTALPRLVWHEDEPLCWPSSVSLYFVAELASQHVKVVLTGEGADELFGGYSRYRVHRMNEQWAPLYEHLPNAVRRSVRSAIAGSPLLSADLRRKLQHTLLGRDDTLESRYLDNFYCAFSARDLEMLFAEPVTRGNPYSSFLDHWSAREGDSLVARMLYADQKTYLVELLMKQDQMSMAWSIESRVPLLDHRFVEFAASVPDGLKLRSSGKYILKKAVEGLLPRDMMYLRKRGFPTPLRRWLREPRAAPIVGRLLARNGLLASYLRVSEIDKLLEAHRHGVLDATDRIWRLVNLQIWGDVFLRGDRGLV